MTCRHVTRKTFIYIWYSYSRISRNVSITLADSKVPFELEFPSIGETELGYISVAEKESLPFAVKRVYWTYYTPQNVERGGHAHKALQQILIAVSGTIFLDVEISSGQKFHFVLDSPSKGVYLPSMCWRTMKYSHSAVQICFASEEYDEGDYIREYEQFSGRIDEV